MEFISLMSGYSIYRHRWGRNVKVERH